MTTPKPIMPARILITEDSSTMTKVLKEILTSFGYAVVGVASSGEAALEIAAQEKPDLLLMDINLGYGLDGIQTAERIQAFMDVPVVYLTGNDDSDTLERVKGAGLFGFLLKPFKPNELIITIEIALYKHRMEQQLRAAQDDLRRAHAELETVVERRTAELVLVNETLRSEISEREGIEEHLRENQERFEGLVNTAFDAIVSVDDHQDIILFNKGAERIFGYKPEEIIGKPLDVLLPQESKDAHRQYVQSYGTQSKRHNGRMGEHREINARHRNGSLFSAEVSISKLSVGGQNVSTAILRDISERKKSEQQLRAAKAFSDELISGVPGIFFCFTTEGRLLRWNRMFEIMLEYSGEAIGRMHPLEFIVPEDRPRVSEMFLETFQHGRMDVELTLLTGSGHRPTYRIVGRVVGALGYPVLLATGLDLTAHKLTEDALRRSEEQYRTLVENLNDAIFTMDANGSVTYVSPAIEKATGFSGNDIMGQAFMQIVHPDDLDGLMQNFQTALQGNSLRFEFRIINKEGKIRYGQISCSPIFEENHLKDIGGVYTDITESKARLRAEEQARILQRQAEDLLAAQEAAEQASNLKSEFMANMSHEIRTPLNGIIGVADLLEQTNLTSQQRGYVNIINRSGGALLSLINDILDFSKIEAGKLTLESIHINLRSQVEGTIQLLSEEASRKGLRLSCVIEKDVPDSLLGDPNRLRQILLNLVNNAIKFTERGEVTVAVRAVVHEPSRVALRFAVSDTGIGISQEGQARLFQPFIQADGSTTRKYGGTGLGLSIIKQIVELMGGALGLNSETGKGSTFWFEVPLEKDAWESSARSLPKASIRTFQRNTFVSDIPSGEEIGVAESGAAPETSKPACGSTEPSGAEASPAIPTDCRVRVLVVEDNEVNQIVLTGMLHRPGFEIDSVSNGREAIEAVQRASYDLVFMDCHLPEVDGWEATAQIRELERETTTSTIIIALTADALAGDKERCFAAGMDDYISKPVKLATLNNVIAKWMSRLSASPKGFGEEPSLRNFGQAEAPSKPTADQHEASVLDYARIQELRDVESEYESGVLSKTVNLYLKNTPSQLAQLRQALEISDWRTVEMVSHSLKGASANVGAIFVARHCATLEKNARPDKSGELHHLRATIDDAASEFERVQPFLKAELELQAEDKA